MFLFHCNHSDSEFEDEYYDDYDCTSDVMSRSYHASESEDDDVYCGGDDDWYDGSLDDAESQPKQTNQTNQPSCNVSRQLESEFELTVDEPPFKKAKQSDCPVSKREKNVGCHNDAKQLNKEKYTDCDNSHDITEPPFKMSKKILYPPSLNGMTPKNPIDSFWYSYYVQCPLVEYSSFLTRFRKRFGLPYSEFKELVNHCKRSDLFQRWSSNNVASLSSTPIELLVLGSLRSHSLSTFWTFGDSEKSTYISSEVHCDFFDIFNDFGKTTHGKKYSVFA